jgi:uncharacterized membrane protein
MDLWSVLMLFGSALCHQIPDRSYLLGDLQMPLCARCIGIHVGFLLSSIALWIGGRKFSSAMPGKSALATLGAMEIVGVALALASYAGLGGSDNPTRTISGLLIGVPIPFVAIPLLNLTVFHGRNSRIPFESYSDWLLLAAAYLAGLALIFLSTSSIIIFVAVSILGIVGICVLVFTIGLLFIGVLTDKKSMTAKRRIMFAIILASAFLIVSTAIHYLLLPGI